MTSHLSLVENSMRVRACSGTGKERFEEASLATAVKGMQVATLLQQSQGELTRNYIAMFERSLTPRFQKMRETILFTIMCSENPGAIHMYQGGTKLDMSKPALMKGLFDNIMSHREEIEYLLWMLSDNIRIDQVLWLNHVAFLLTRKKPQNAFLKADIFHTGHIDVLKWLLGKCEKILAQVRVNGGLPDRTERDLEIDFTEELAKLK